LGLLDAFIRRALKMERILVVSASSVLECA
jgi:hypothetical protein